MSPVQKSFFTLVVMVIVAIWALYLFGARVRTLAIATAVGALALGLTFLIFLLSIRNMAIEW